MRNIFLIVVFLFFLIVSMFSCKPSEEDIQYEKLLEGKWIAVQDINGIKDTMYYEFKSDNRGSTTYLKENNEFAWEVKRHYINTIYKKSPSYYIGYDKYNSKGYYKINSLTEQKADLTQIYYQGLETNRILVKQ